MGGHRRGEREPGWVDRLRCCELVKEARATGTRPEAAILDLARWSVTTQHLDLREQLGLALVVDARAADTAPLSLRTGRRP